MKKLIGILLAITLFLTTTIPVYADTTQTVTITATPSYVALTNDTATWVMGVVLINTMYWWTVAGAAPAEPLVDGDMKAIITNTGSVNEDIDIHTHAATGGAGWAISNDETTAADEFSLRVGITGMANMAAMIQCVAGDAELKDALAAAGHVHWCMSLETATGFADGLEKTIIVTLTASVAD
jgi:hypothetical protein